MSPVSDVSSDTSLSRSCVEPSKEKSTMMYSSSPWTLDAAKHSKRMAIQRALLVCEEISEKLRLQRVDELTMYSIGSVFRSFNITRISIHRRR